MRTPLAIGAAVLMLSWSAALRGQDATDERLTRADEAYEQGDFAAARPQYEAALAAVPHDARLHERLAFIDFFTCRYPEAIAGFAAVAQADPSRRDLMLAYTTFAQYLTGDYAGVVTTMETLGPVNVLNVDQVRAMSHQPPYRIEPGAADQVVLPFLQSDPLPVVEIEVNSHEASVLIDTGAAQLILDPEFANEVAVKPTSSQEVRGFAGGTSAPVSYGMAQSVSLGGIGMGNVPVWVLPTRTFSPDLGRRIDGVLGTEVLMQFLPTLAYRDAQLVLRLKTEENRAAVRTAKAGAIVPFIIDGIHYMYGPCYINGKGPALTYFDSGMADDHGAALRLSGAALDDLHLSRPALSERGVGGGGAFEYGYVDIESIRVGSLVQHGLKATYSGGEGSLLSAAGYKKYGLLSHNFLKHYNWTIDFERREFRFDE
jgi:hypothetical protein